MYEDESDETVRTLAGNFLTSDTELLSTASAVLKKRRILRTLKEPWTCDQLLGLYPQEWFDQLLGISFETFCKLYEVLKVKVF